MSTTRQLENSTKGAIISNESKAQALAKIGIYVFPVKVEPKADNPTRTTKKPLTENGFLDATTDATQISKWWKQFKDAQVGVAMGKSGLMAVDFDRHLTPDGEIEVDGFENFSELFLDIPTTYSFESVSETGGEQYIFLAPADKTLGPDQNYRGVKGMDIRAGGSYSVWNGEAPASRDVFAEAPEWALDEKAPRSTAEFEGSVKDWYDSLVPGKPSLPVRVAMDKIKATFEASGNDLTHKDIIDSQHNAIRLGAEGHPGVEEFLDLIKELCNERLGDHSRSPDEYEHEFLEGLASGVVKHGGATELRLSMPKYSLSLVPSKVRTSLVTGDPVGKEGFRELLAALLPEVLDDLVVLSILWNCPATKDISREWGLEFCLNNRIKGARITPEPVGENPILDARELDTTAVALLSHDEKEFVREHPTFIDQYLAASAKKGFQTREYDIPAAWTLLSMAFGFRAIVPLGKPFGVNMWFIALGDSGTGKSSADRLLKESLDLLLKDGESFYNLGANSSPEGMHEGLLERDRRASMIHHDEASDFFENLKRKDWMSGLKDSLSKWYEGIVDPSHKIRLKDLKGKSAVTSFNMNMLGTPDRLLGLVDTSMFETGFLARFNWTWAPKRPDKDDAKYKVSRSTVDKEGVNPEAYKLVSDLLFARKWMPADVIAMDWTPEAEKRLVEAHKTMDHVAKDRDRYEATEPSVTRLKETVWKCAALLAMWRGETVIRDIDAMTALYYAEEWFNTVFRVVNAAGKGDFNRIADDMEKFIASKEGASEAMLFTRFRGTIEKSPREIQEKIQFLLTSGRIVRDSTGAKYKVNGKGKQ